MRSAREVVHEGVRRASARRRSLLLPAWRGAVLWGALVVAGCDGPGVAGPGRRPVGTVGASITSGAITGTWSRIVYFVDDFGIARATETSWQFAADGGVVRVLVARNYTFGLADVFISAGRYQLVNSRVRVDFVTPSPSTLELEVRRTGNQLELGGQAYLLAGGP